MKSFLEFIPAGEGEGWLNPFSIRIAEHFLLHLENVFLIHSVSPPNFGKWNVYVILFSLSY